MKLRDRVGPNTRVLFVGINPGIRTAQTGHHFAGFSNRFWKLLFDAGLVPERLTSEDDVRLPEFGFGITNLVPRATPGIDTLKASEYAEGERTLRRKVRRWTPQVVAFVGVTLFRYLFRRPQTLPVTLGFQPERFEGAAVVVLPNPSGRNANFSYEEMKKAFGVLQIARRDGKDRTDRRDGTERRDDPQHAMECRNEGLRRMTATPKRPLPIKKKRRQRHRTSS